MIVDATNGLRGGFGWLGFILWNGILAFVLGAVVLVLGLNFAVFAGWLGLMVWSARRLHRDEQPTRAALVLAIQTTVMVLVVTAAHLAPVKTTTGVLERTITLPERSMSLEELGGDPNEPRPDWCPFWISITVPEDQKTRQIRFPETKITVRQFVAALEAQSTLRHRFAHCGNGWTILWGGDCSFGLHLRPVNS